MAEMKKSFKEFMEKHGRSESGFTMAEILVAIALLAVLTAVVTSTIINATQTSDKFSRGTMNESQLLNAVSLITRDISLAKEVRYASDTAVAVDTMEGGKLSSVYYFYWTGTAESIPSAAAFSEVKNNASRISSQPGIVEYRVVNGNTADPTVRTVIEGYNPGGNSEFPLFTYYDGKNKEILLDATNPPQVSAAKLPEIRRIEIHFTSYIDSRDNAMELHTSASPRFLGGVAVGGAVTERLQKPSTPLLYGDLPPRTNTAQLTWTPIAGATGYTVYRTNRNQTPLTTVVATTVNSSLDDPGLAWGETYDYFVVAQGWSGDSNPSTKISLRVTPAPTQFINIDPLRGNTGASITNFTVARNLNNQLTWAPSSGENIKYRLYTVTNGVKTQIYDGPATTYLHSARNYGDVTRYVVVPYNDPIPGYSKTNPGSTTGGTAADSTPVDLISPPIKPVLSGVARNDLTTPSATTATNVLSITNTIPNAKGYTFTYGATDAAANGTQGASGTSKSWNHLPGWGTTNYYAATAYNDAGSSQPSDFGTTPAVKLDQPPGPFLITDLTNNTGYGDVIVQGTETGAISTVKSKGSMSASWNTSDGSTKFNVSRSLNTSFGARTMARTVIDWDSDQSDLASTDRSTTFSNAHPGIVYDVTVQSVAANGLSRNVTSTLLTRPDVPQRGISEGICLANNSATYGMYVDSDTRPKSGYADQTKVTYAREWGGAAAPVIYGIGTSVPAFQNLAYEQWGQITYQNIISRSAVPDWVAAHGTSDSERVSYPLTLEMEVVGHFSGCTSAGRNIPDRVAPSQQGTFWVVPFDVCYGYVPNHNYNQYYMDPNDRLRAGYLPGRAGYWAGMVQNTTGGCLWRLHPYDGREPYWDSVG